MKADKKPKRGRPATNPPGAAVWAVRVTASERSKLKAYLAKLRKRGNAA